MRSVSQQNLNRAHDILNKGGILAVPTETVYGLAVKADNTAAIKKLLKLKDRAVGSGKILTLMVPQVADIRKYANLTTMTHNLSIRYFPGELTMILPKRKSFIHPYFNNFDKIGIRIPEHKYMLSLLQETGPLLVTSANLRGEAPCQTSEEVIERLPSIDGVVNGKAGGNLPSTVIDFTYDEPRPVRQGGLLIVRYR